MMMVPLTPDQVPLAPRIGTSDGNIAALSGRSGRSACALRRHQARDDLTHLISTYSITYSVGKVKKNENRFAVLRDDDDVIE